MFAIFSFIFQQVLNIVESWKEATRMAEDAVTVDLTERKRKLTETIETGSIRLEAKKGKWDDTVITEMQDDIEKHKESLQSINCLLSEEPDDTKSRKKLTQMRRRKAIKMFEERGVKRRAIINQGRPSLLDSDDEDFVAKSIEDKATYHGRRHDLVMYTNRRVKKRDLLNIANYKLLSKNKRMIKSATTAYNRSKPRSLRSIQAKKHRGKGLFCTKKPPKAEDIDNENTHYQRAHVKNVKCSFFGKDAEDSSHLCFMRSIDDKAYLRPGTSEGFYNTRNQRILTSTDVDNARTLPKYDWPEKLVYQTPGAHRIFSKTSTMSDVGGEKLVTKEDSHFVFVRRKAIVGSSGSTWASETIRLRQRNPDIFEVEASGENYSVQFRQSCALIHNACFLYQDMTDKDDFTKATGLKHCVYTCYENERLHNLNKELDSALSVSESLESEAEQQVFLHTVHTKVAYVKERLEECFQDAPSGDDFHQSIQDVTICCRDILTTIKDLQLPSVKPRWCDLTDAGPGVGVSNFEVKFRDAEMCRMFGSDYRIRLHRSRGDSGQGEAERTNSAIGDSVVDGSTIEWEQFRKFEGMAQEDIDALGVKEYEELEEERMKKNAWHVSKLLVERIDGAPVLGERIKSYLSEPNHKMFYFNQKYLVQYNSSSSDSARNTVPGSAYIEKVLKFFDAHYKVGELYMEFIKCACDGEKDGCESCISWTGLPAKRVPQPVPDPERACHYLPVADTPLCTENDTPRPVDDWQPRANITKLFQDGEISLQQQDEITTFSETFYVKREYVVASIEHLTNLQSTKQIRSRGRAEEQRHRKERKYDEYDWINLVLQGELSKLTIPELDKYITENKLNKKGKKKDKLDAITADVLRKHQGRPIEDLLEPQHRDQASSESDSDQDIVLEEFGSESDPESETEDEPENEQIQTVDPVPLVVQTRYGRYAGNWALSELH